jgi:AraC-like DNA-binding protein/quercetin dioxygenase-like cupin family protein
VTVAKTATDVLDDSAKNLDDPLMTKSRIPQLKGAKYFPDLRFRLHVMRIEGHHVSRPHTHDFEELVVILDGKGKHQVGREVYDIGAGDVFVMLNGMNHCYPEAKGLSLINLLYDTANLRLPQADLGALPGYHALFQVEPRLRQQQRFQNRLKLDMDELGRLAVLIGELEAELRAKAAGSHFLATAHFMRIFGWLARAYSRIPVANQRPLDQISKLLGHLERHYADPLSIDDLAKFARMSQSSLFRLFRHLMGRSPVDYLIRLRIGKAAQILRREPLRISEVSAAVGFSDSNYFSRQFHHVMGMSPRDYRRRSPTVGLSEAE